MATHKRLQGDNTFDRYFEGYLKAMGWTKPAAKVDIPVLPHTGLSVVAGDAHAPFQHDDAIRQMISRTAHKAERLILAGDLADMFNVSQYAKYKAKFTPLQEIVRVKALLAVFAANYREVILMRGNHDDRFIKHLQRMGMPPAIFEVFDYLHGEYSLHPVYVLARPFKNVTVVEPIKHDEAEFAYLYQQGDAVISHAEAFSQIPNKAVGNVIQSLKSFHETQGIIKPFRVCIQAHTHQAGKTWCDFKTVGIENGCLCITPEYAGDPKRLPRRPSVLGWTELWQSEGVTDISRTNFVPYLSK